MFYLTLLFYRIYTVIGLVRKFFNLLTIREDSPVRFPCLRKSRNSSSWTCRRRTEHVCVQLLPIKLRSVVYRARRHEFSPISLAVMCFLRTRILRALLFSLISLIFSLSSSLSNTYALYVYMCVRCN